MEIERDQIKKTFFGNYRAADVDRVLDAAEKRLREQEAERAGEAARISAAQGDAEKLSAELSQLRETADRLNEDNRRQQEQNRKLNEENQTRRDEAQSLRAELESLRQEMEELRTELDLANSQTAILGNRLARQRRELDEKDRLLLEDPVGEANKRAEQIIQNATNISKQMIDDAENMRSRALAAVRAAYFNTVGFRQNLEERFGSLQNDLDQSVRMLRLIETEDEHAAPDYVQEKW